MTRWLLALVLGLLFVAGCTAAQPGGSSGSPSMLRRADAAFERGDYSEAVLLYRSFLNTSPSEQDTDQATYRMAAAYYRLGRYDEAAKLLEDLRASDPEALGAAGWALYGDIEAARGHNVSALLFWERSYMLAPDDDRALLSARVAGLINNLSDEERRQARPLASTDYLRRALDAPKRLSTPTAIPAPSASQPPTPTPTPGEDSARIGLLLPLSGKNRSIGEASLDGARIAAGHDEDLAPFDSGSTPAGTLRQFEGMHADVSIAAVVGPLRGDDVSAIAPRAGADSMPLLPLSQNEAVVSPFVFQTAMTRTLQTQTLAAYAVRRLHLKRFAVVHPGDTYGARISDLFRSAVQSEGGRVVGAVTYTPGQTDFSRVIDDLHALDAGGTLEAAFLPDSAATIALLAPEIRRDFPRLQLLGSSEWNEGFILAGVSKSLEGSIFVDGFYANSARPATKTFVEKFRRRYGRRPGLLEAQAHDAVALVEAAIARGAFTRQEIQLMLENLGLFEGAGGTIEITDGIVRRQLFVLRFSNGSLEELSW